MSTLDEKIAALKAKQGIEDKSARTKAKKKATKKKVSKTGGSRKGTRKINGKATPPAKQNDINGLFAHAYVRYGCNATAAYRETHPKASDTTAATNGWKMLRKAEVQRIVFPLIKALLQKSRVDAEWVLKRWLEQADGSALDYFTQNKKTRELSPIDLDELNDAQRRNLKSIKISDNQWGQTISITVADQQHAVDMLAKYLQMLTDKTDPEDADRIGDLIEQGVKRIRAHKDLNAWQTDYIEAQFSNAS